MPEPQYMLVPRLVGLLARGELVVEPALGPVRVAAVKPESNDDPDSEFVRVRWRDEHGPGTAACRYLAHQSLLVRMPAPVDRVLVRCGIDLAARNRCEISDDIACLIAAHLHAGPGSGLHRFTVDGSIHDQLFDELEVAARHRRYAQDWVHALARHCLAREDIGPMPAWSRRTMSATEARASERLASAGIDIDALRRAGHKRDDRPSRYPALLAFKLTSTEVVTQLIDAAFLLGVTAAQRRTLPAIVEERLDELVGRPVDGAR